MEKKNQKKKLKNELKNLQSVAISLAISSMAISIMMTTLKEMADSEVRDRLWQLKKQGATEYIIKRRKEEIVYDKIKGLKRKLEIFAKKNPRYKLSEESFGEGYKRYRLDLQKEEKFTEKDGYCSKCGHYLDDYDDY